MKGHTLIELLIVITIISIMSVVAIPVAQGLIIKNRIDDLKGEILNVSAYQEKFFAANGRYASDLNELLTAGLQLDNSGKIKIDTALILNQGLTPSYYVVGSYDIDKTHETYKECWAYFGLNSGANSGSFVQLYDDLKNKQVSFLSNPPISFCSK